MSDEERNLNGGEPTDAPNENESAETPENAENIDGAETLENAETADGTENTENAEVKDNAENSEVSSADGSSAEGVEENAPRLGKNGKPKRKRRKDMTPEERKKKSKRDWIITGCVFGLVALLIGIFALTGFLGTKANTKMVGQMEAVGNVLTPVIDSETGYWTFTTDNDFKVLQLTDVHIGAGAFSIQKDNWALNACATLIRNEKPDLVIVTGDIAYPVPFQAGTFDNKREAELFATLMEQLDVYWAPCFGNHDTEAYSMYSREDIAAFYSEDRWEHCLFQCGPDSADGSGNYIVNVKNSLGLITQSLVMIDSHSYTNGDIFGVNWDYDNIHQNQIDWYASEITKLNNSNKTTFASLTESQQSSYAATLGTTVSDFQSSSMIKSSMYFHIPLTEYRDAWNEYVDNGNNDTADVKYNFGVAGETGKVVYSGIGEDEMFETILSLGSTKWTFCGHDHLNNFSVTYKGVTLTYGYSIDYLAYFGIQKKYEQRGCTTMVISYDTSATLAQHKLIDY